MLWRWGADVVVVLHVAYLVYAATGGFLALRRRAWLWPHLTSSVWSVVVTFTAVGCPLTALEKGMLARAGDPVYEGSFTAFYLRDVLYPAAWEPVVWLTMMGTAAASYLVLVLSARAAGPARRASAAGRPASTGEL